MSEQSVDPDLSGLIVVAKWKLRFIGDDCRFLIDPVFARPDYLRVCLRHNYKGQILKSVNIEVFLIEGNNIMYPCIHREAYYRSISIIHRQI